MDGTEKLSEGPVGTCNSCGAFTCAQHGVRDPSYPRFVCMLCFPAIALTQAATQAEKRSTGYLVAMQKLEPTNLSPVSDWPRIYKAHDYDDDAARPTTATVQNGGGAAIDGFEVGVSVLPDEVIRAMDQALEFIEASQIQDEHVAEQLLRYREERDRGE